MTQRSEPSSRRERPAKPALSRAGIIATAVRLVRTEGLDRITMRRLAQELDMGPASLYVYLRYATAIAAEHATRDRDIDSPSDEAALIAAVPHASPNTYPHIGALGPTCSPGPAMHAWPGIPCAGRRNRTHPRAGLDPAATRPLRQEPRRNDR